MFQKNVPKTHNMYTKTYESAIFYKQSSHYGKKNSYNYRFENYREISHIKLGFFKKFSKITTSHNMCFGVLCVLCFKTSR